MKSQVIVPLDGSTYAEAILPHALFFAQQTQSLLTLLRIIMPPGEPEYTVPYIPDDWYDGEVSWTNSYLTSLATRLQAQGVHVQTALTDGDSEAFIERLHGQNRKNLLIVTTRKQAEHRVMRFLHQSNVPVLFIAL